MLKTDKLRHMIFGLDTDVCFSYDDGQGKVMETILQIHQLIANAFNVVIFRYMEGVPMAQADVLI